jgi:hypothetical protein
LWYYDFLVVWWQLGILTFLSLHIILVQVFRPACLLCRTMGVMVATGVAA